MMIETTQNVQQHAQDLMRRLVLMGMSVAAFAVVIVFFVAA